MDSRRAQWIQGGKKMTEDVDDALQLLIEQQSEWKDEEVVEYVCLCLVADAQSANRAAAP